MNSTLIASRTLKFVEIDSKVSGELIVEIFKPYLLKEEMVDFAITSGCAGCSLRVRGIDTDFYDQEVYGVDSVQALELASNVEGMLKHISKKYDLYFETGEPYFE